MSEEPKKHPGTTYAERLVFQQKKVLSCITDYLEEARKNEKEPRREQNTKNWKMYHGKIDWRESRENEGVDWIHLHKLSLAAEQHKAKFKQGLMNFDKWLQVDLVPGHEPEVITDSFAKNLMRSQLEKADVKTVVSDALLVGLMESRACLRVSGMEKPKPRFIADGNKLSKTKNKEWQLDLQVRLFEEYLKDPENLGLYEIEELLIDRKDVIKLVNKDGKPSPKKPYNLDAFERLTPFTEEREQEDAKKQAEGNTRKMKRTKRRKSILIHNFWGIILDDDGDIFQWEKEDGKFIPLENVLITLGNEKEILRDPISNPRWSGTSGFIETDLVRSPINGKKAIMDAGVELNESADNLFTMLLEGAYKSAHNVTAVRGQYVVNKEVLSGGVKAGDSLEIDESAPANVKVLESISVGEVPQDGLQMLGVIERAFEEGLFLNQINLGGGIPKGQPSATSVVAAQQAISGVFESIAADIEDKFIEKLAIESWHEILQNSSKISDEEIRAAFQDRERADRFLAMSPAERFADGAQSFKFRGKGIQSIAANAGQAQQLINFMSLMVANPQTAEAVKEGVSPAKLFQAIAKRLNIDLEEIAPDQGEIDQMRKIDQIRQQALIDNELQGGQNAKPGAANASQQEPGGVEGSVPGSGAGLVS